MFLRTLTILKLIRKHSLQFLLFILSLPVFAQTPMKITGKVIDEKTMRPLSNVNIQINGTLKGTITDKDGSFELSYKGKDFILIISYLGYEKKFIKLNEIPKDPLTITLSPRAEVLGEVVISSSTIETIVKSDNSYVLDYGFYSDNILVITFRSSLTNSKLILLNSALDTLSKIDIPEKPSKLFKDCLGNNHVVCNKNIYQVYFDSERLKLLPPVNVEKFETVLYPCVAQDSANLYFMTKMGSRKMVAEGFNIKTHNHILNYYYVNKIDRKRKNLVYIEDQKTLKMSREEDSFGEQKVAMGARGGSGRLFAEVIVFKEIFAPLYLLNNNVYIFDYINSKILNYSAGEIVKETGIKFHNEKNWKREMCIDEKRNSIYTIYENNGITELKEINLNNGLPVNSYKIPYPFVENIKVHDNYIYFLYQGKEYFNTKFLSRLKVN